MVLGRKLGWNCDLNTAVYEEEMIRIVGGRKGRIVTRSTYRPPSMEISSLFNGGETTFEESAFVKYH